jgi:dienelactone hydrolase
MDWRGEFYRHDPKLPLEAEEKLLRSDERIDRWRVEFTGMNEHRVPAVLTRPRGAARPPVALILHGVTGSKEAPYVRAAARGLLGGGFATIAIDSPYHGDRARSDRDMRFHNFTSYTNRNAAVQSALDCMRAVDYVQSRNDLDGERLGFVGFSQGAIVGTAFCACDERVKAVALVVGGGNFLRMYPPAKNPAARARAERIAQTIDPVHHVARIAPRPLLMINATRDELIPRKCAEDLFDAARSPKEILWHEATHTGLPAEAFRTVRGFLLREAAGIDPDQEGLDR